jgi:hypothetical protein
MDDVGEKIIGIVEEALGKDVEVLVKEIIHKNPRILTSGGLSIKLGLRLAKTIGKGQKPGGMRTISFFGSAASSGLTLAAWGCHTGSKVVFFINCDHLVPMLSAAALTTSMLADKMETISQNATFGKQDFFDAFL